MHNLHTFEHRLSWFYTCVNRQGKEKSKKIRRKRATVAPYLAASSLRRSFASTFFPLSIKDGEGARG